MVAELRDEESQRVSFLRSLAHLWRHRYFRRLLAVRIATQSGDGVLQIALASFVLFSPERQPDATSLAIVLAVTLLPFSILGPFVGVVLDRWSRRQILVLTDLSRSILALGLAALVVTGLRTSGVENAFYALVLLAISLNRFLLAPLSCVWCSGRSCPTTSRTPSCSWWPRSDIWSVRGLRYGFRVVSWGQMLWI